MLYLASALVAALLQRHNRYQRKITFSLAALASIVTLSAGVQAVSQGGVTQAVIPIGLPDLPFHLRLDPLSGFFLTLIGTLSFFVSIYSIGYVKGFAKRRRVTSLLVFYCIFLAGMCAVLLANDALSFLVSWEIMAASSYFLVLFEHEHASNKRAALMYLVIAHVGAIAILLSFGVLAGMASGFGNFEGYTFDAIRQADLHAGWATTAFLLALFGFGAKAGIVPLHVWLPEAHPVAPSNVSALMSGAMLKTAVYGLLRVTFDLIGTFPWWWGSVVFVLGICSAIMGILFALMEKDLKRLLAFSSVENIGIVFTCLGLSMIYHSFGIPMLAALALVAGLYLCMNHAMYKGLLFMGAGAVLHATEERDMEQMGSLIHHMPWTSAFFLVGCLSIAGLPPFNGFVSEWLTFQAFLLSPSLPSPIIKLILPMGAAIFALTVALSSACFVKVYGVTFLGHWRSRKKPLVHEVGGPMRIAMMLAAIACLVLGVLPPVFIAWMDTLPVQMTGASLSSSVSEHGWMWLVSVGGGRASYSGLVTLIVLPTIILLAYLLLHVKPGTLHRAPIWDCGFEKINSRMQYNSTSFAMPIRVIFGFLFRIKERVTLTRHAGHKAFPVSINYSLKVRDLIWGWMYRPIIDVSFWLAKQAGRLQQGNINTYLIYSFVTIIVLLVFMR